MIFLLALIPATALTVAGYVALFLSHRSEGALRTFGRYLGIWAFILAGLVALGGMFAAGHMHRMHAEWGAHEGRYCPWMEGRDSDRGWERHERGGPGAPPEGAAPPSTEAKAPAGQTPPPPPSGR